MKIIFNSIIFLICFVASYYFLATLIGLISGLSTFNLNSLFDLWKIWQPATSSALAIMRTLLYVCAGLLAIIFVVSMKRK